MQRQQVLLCTIQQVLFCDQDDPRVVSQCKDSKCCFVQFSKCCFEIRLIREKSLNAKTASAALYLYNSASAVLWLGQWSERSLSMQMQTQWQQVLLCLWMIQRANSKCQSRSTTSTIILYLGIQREVVHAHQWVSRWTQEQSWGQGDLASNRRIKLIDHAGYD